MKIAKIILGIVISSLTLTAMAQEFRVNGIYVMPGDDDVWDNAYGGELSGILWLNEYIGFLGSFGVESYTVNDDETVDSSFTGKRWSGRAGGWIYRNLPVYRFDAWSTDGSATIIPIGLSGLARVPFSESVSLVFEGGVKYLIINSDIDIEGRYQEVAVYNGQKVAQGYVRSYKEEVDVDNGFIGLAAVDLNISLTDTLSMNIGGGYRFDLSKPEAEAESFESTEVEMKGAFARAGVSLKF